MRNLAGEKMADEFIRNELTRAGIEIVENDTMIPGEVPCKTTGRLVSSEGGVFTFKRNWYYWVVKGPVPYEKAIKLYKHPEGRRTVRVVGHCGCPHPDDWVADIGNSEMGIDSYHIDDQAGLLLFVMVMKDLLK